MNSYFQDAPFCDFLYKKAPGKMGRGMLTLLYGNGVVYVSEDTASLMKP